MTNSKAILISTAVGMLMLGGSALAQDASVPTEGQQVAEQARVEMARGNDWMGTNLQKRATTLEPTDQNYFNLATGYQRTDRLNTAKTYYQSLAAHTEGETMTAPLRDGGTRTFDTAFESADRLLYIDWVQNNAGRGVGGGAASADAAATNVSATVGGAGEYEVTDEQARALDRRR